MPRRLRASDTGTNADVIITVTPSAVGQIKGGCIYWSYSKLYDDAPVGSLEVFCEDLESLLGEPLAITTSGPGFLPLDDFEGEPGEELVITLKAGGAGVIGTVAYLGRER